VGRYRHSVNLEFLLLQESTVGGDVRSQKTDVRS